MDTIRLEKPIAIGRTAEVYPWESGKVLKLFREWFPFEAAKAECRVATQVFEAGLPVPAVGELLQINGRTGLVYQRLDGASLMDLIGKQPLRLVSASYLLAKLHAQVHQCSIKDLPNRKQRIGQRIELSQLLTSEEKKRLLQNLEQLPDGTSLCHGDFHPGNILMTTDGPIVIDWMDASSGDPLSDVARTLVLTEGKTPKDAGNIPSVLAKVLKLFGQVYLWRYCKLTGAKKEAVLRWVPVTAAARLDEGIVEAQERLLELARSV